jgi:capsular polysaccharide biosynthesis protein
VNFYYKPRNGYLLDTVYFSPFNSLAFKDNDYFLESSFNQGRLKREILKKKNNKIIESNEICSSILNGVYLNHYHIMIDVVPRILALRKLVKKNNFKVDLYITKDFDKYYDIFLRFIDKRITIKIVNRNDIVFSKKFLVLPYLSSNTNGYLPYKYIKYINNSLYKANTKKIINKKNIQNEKIYISRRLAKKRKLLNERKFINFLKKKKFRIVYLEEQSILEQYKIFENAKIVISVHGAGLTNIIFSKPRTKIIEIIPTNNKLLFHYRFLSSACFHEYYSFTSSAKDKNDNFYLDIKNFNKKFYKYL